MASVASPSARSLSLARQFTALELTLAANSEDWKPRAAALAELERLVSDGLHADGFDAFSEVCAPLLASLSTALVVQVTDLRSEIVRQCAHTLSFLAVNLQAAFARCAVKVFPALLKVASGTNGVIRAYAAPCASDVVQHVQHPSLLVDLLHELRSSKNKLASALCSALLLSALQRWSTRQFRKSAALVEEGVVGLLSAADASTRSTAGQCVLLYLEHFPARSRPLLQALDPRAARLVNDCRRTHTPAANASAAVGKGRSDSISSVDGLAGGAEEGDEEKRPTAPVALVTRPQSASVGGSGERARFAYGAKVEIVEALTARADVDDSAAGLHLAGRKGTVISCSQREGRTGEWVGVRLDPDTDAEDGDATPRGVAVVYVRPSTLRKEGWRVTRLRAPTIDTSHVLKAPSPQSYPSASSSPLYPSSASVPPSPTPSSASSYVTPSSGRSTASSYTRATPSPGLRKSDSSQSIVDCAPLSPAPGVPSPASSASSARSVSSASAASSAVSRLRSPPSVAGRASTSPASRIPSAPAAAAVLARTSVLPSSRIPLPPSRLTSRAQSRTQSRAHSRADSGRFSLRPSPTASPSSSPQIAPASPQQQQLLAAAAPSAFALTQPLPAPSTAAAAHLSPELSALLALHREYEAELSAYRGALSAALEDADAAASDERGYSDAMIRLLSEQLTRTTRLLEAFVGVKKRGVQQARTRMQEQSASFDAWLESNDNFRR